MIAEAGGGRLGGVLEQRQVQPIVPAILLRLAGGDALGQDARLHHLDREGAPRTAVRYRVQIHYDRAD